MKENCVGNGGFSLRRHKLAVTTSKIDFKSLKFPIKSEDIVICHYLYKEMLRIIKDKKPIATNPIPKDE